VDIGLEYIIVAILGGVCQYNFYPVGCLQQTCYIYWWVEFFRLGRSL